MTLSSPTRSILTRKTRKGAQEVNSLQKNMSARQRVPEHSLPLFILFTSAWSLSNKSWTLNQIHGSAGVLKVSSGQVDSVHATCITCSLYDFVDYIDNNIQGNDITFGDCSFEKTLCNYTQACTDGDANNWTVSDGSAVCPGRNGLYESFSVLMSPLLNVTQNTSLVFNYSQASPGRLSVFLATATGIQQVLPEEIRDVSDQQVVFNINSSLVKVGFKARMANNGSRVTLTYVKLQVSPLYVTVTGTLNTRDQSVTSTSTKTAGTQKQGGSTSGIIAAVVVPVVVVGGVGGTAGVLLGFFLWRRCKQRQNRSGKAGKVSQKVYQSAEIRSVTSAGTSQDKPPTNYGRTVHVISGTSGIQFDIPSNGLPVKHRIDKSDRHCLPKFTSPTVSDHKYENYNTLGEDLAVGTRVVCNYSKTNGVNSLNSNNDGNNYNRVNTPGGKPRWQGEGSSDLDTDYNYNHISSGDRDAAVRFRSGEISKSSSKGQRNGNNDVSRDDENRYRTLLRAASKKLYGFTDKSETTAEPYNHVTGDVHGDYDRIRQRDRNNVIGYDYDHFV